MSRGGHIYGVALNDRAEREALSQAFAEDPYLRPPKAPVIYMKPATSIACGPVRLTPGQTVTAAATLALMFARDAERCPPELAWSHVGAVALAIDISLPQQNYYRPAVPQMNRDGFLAFGEWQVPETAAVIALDAAEQRHEWPLERLHRSPAQLISDLSEFMTLRAGDVLLVGLAGDAPVVSAPVSLTASADGHPDLTVTIEERQA